MSVQPFLPHNDLGVEEKNGSRARFPPEHQRPNLGKRVSMNLCHTAGLRIPIVPMIEPFHFRRAANILHPVATDTSALVCMHHGGDMVRPLRHTCTYREDRDTGK